MDEENGNIIAGLRTDDPTLIPNANRLGSHLLVAYIGVVGSGYEWTYRFPAEDEDFDLWVNVHFLSGDKVLVNWPQLIDDKTHQAFLILRTSDGS